MRRTATTSWPPRTYVAKQCISALLFCLLSLLCTLPLAAPHLPFFLESPVSDPSRLLGNLAAIIVLGLGMAYLTDRLWLWFGWHPWAFCGLLPILDEVIGHTIALIVAMVSVIVFFFSRMKNTGAGMLFLGALVLSSVPGLFGGYLGAYCTPSGQLVDQAHKTSPGSLGRSQAPAAP